MLFPEPDGPRTASDAPAASANPGIRSSKPADSPAGRRKTSPVVSTSIAVDGICTSVFTWRA